MSFWIILIVLALVFFFTPAKDFLFSYGNDPDFQAFARKTLLIVVGLVVIAIVLWAILPKF